MVWPLENILHPIQKWELVVNQAVFLLVNWCELIYLYCNYYWHKSLIKNQLNIQDELLISTVSYIGF